MNTLAQDTDKTELVALVRAAQRGERDAFGTLFERFERHVMAIALRRLGDYGEAQELCQDVFIQAMKKIRQLRERTPLVKWMGSERTLWVARAAVQVHGGYGVVQEYDVERHYRNALILPIYEGTSQIQALMSLKDQVGWTLQAPWRVLTGAVRVEAPPDTLGDGLRDLAAEYNAALRYVSGNAAILYHTGRLNREQTIDYIQTYGLVSPERAAKSFSFLSHPLYRSYVFTYSVGYDLIHAAADPAAIFRRLLTEQVLPSQLAAGA